MTRRPQRLAGGRNRLRRPGLNPLSTNGTCQLEKTEHSAPKLRHLGLQPGHQGVERLGVGRVSRNRASAECLG